MRQLLITIFLLSFSLVASAQGIKIVVTQGVDNPTPIAISPFSWSGVQALPEDVSGIIEANLARTGLFDVMPRGNMLSQPNDLKNVFFRDWRALKRDYLVVGKMYRDGEKIVIDYHLVDIISQKTLFSKRKRSSESGLRDVAHLISDEIFYAITDIMGAFSTKILYVTTKKLGDRKFNYQLFYADADGQRARRILNSDEPIMSPTWSPDGREIAYVSFENGWPNIWRQVIATGERENLTPFQGINSSPAWSPDGRYMAMSLDKDGSADIYVMDLQTKQLKKLAPHYGIDTEPQWMPDGQSIVFTSDRGGKPQVYRVDVNTGKVNRLTFDGDYNARPVPIPDGSGIILVHKKGGQFHIARFDEDDGRTYVLTGTQLDESPSIAANGIMVMYATKHKGQAILATVSVDGRIKSLLPSDSDNIREPALSPHIK